MEELTTKKGGNLLELGKAQRFRAFKQAWLMALSGERLIDVTRMARLSGIESQTMITQAAWLGYVSPRDFGGQALLLYDLLFALSCHEPEIMSRAPELLVEHDVVEDDKTVARLTLKVVSRSGFDDRPPVLVLMLPQESPTLM